MGQRGLPSANTDVGTTICKGSYELLQGLKILWGSDPLNIAAAIKEYMAFELIFLCLGQLVPSLVAGLHEILEALELSWGVADLLACHITTGSTDVADIDRVVSLPPTFGDLALFTNYTVVDSNDSTGGAIGGFDTSFAIRIHRQIPVAIVAMALKGLGMVRPVVNTEVMHLGLGFLKSKYNLFI